MLKNDISTIILKYATSLRMNRLINRAENLKTDASIHKNLVYDKSDILNRQEKVGLSNKYLDNWLIICKTKGRTLPHTLVQN